VRTALLDFISLQQAAGGLSHERHLGLGAVRRGFNGGIEQVNCEIIGMAV
jgi:hypothetical protein